MEAGAGGQREALERFFSVWDATSQRDAEKMRSVIATARETREFLARKTKTRAES